MTGARQTPPRPAPRLIQLISVRQDEIIIQIIIITGEYEPHGSATVLIKIFGRHRYNWEIEHR